MRLDPVVLIVKSRTSLCIPQRAGSQGRFGETYGEQIAAAIESSLSPSGRRAAAGVGGESARRLSGRWRLT